MFPPMTLATRSALLFSLLGLAVLPACEVEPGDISAAEDAGDTGDSDTQTQALTVRYDRSGGSFYDMPWPSDARLTGDGHVDLSDFPENDDPFVGLFLDVIEAEVSGFSTMPVVYIGLDSLPGIESVPTPAQTLESDSSVQLLDVSGANCGLRHPIEVGISSREDRFLEPNLIMAAPVPGFVLAPETPYALVVLERFGSESGFHLESPAAFQAAMDAGNHGLDLLSDCLDGAGLVRDDIAVATVFTTQDPVGELLRMRNQVADPDRTQTPEISDWRLEDAASIAGRYQSWRGTFSTPIFQAGESPYAGSGGGLVFDADGEPEVQRWEDVPFMITWPETSDPPYPVLIWEDGTFADLTSHVHSNVTARALRAGFAIATFEAQFHGERATPGSDEQLHTFNYFNPESFRTVFRQQAVDTAYFVRLLRESIDELEGLPEVETGRLVYAGQSQGAIVGAITAGVEPGISAYALNGVGAYLSITMIERQDPDDINLQLRTLMGVEDPLNRFHPLVALAQLGGDVADPINFGPRWRGWEGAESGSSLFLINGQLDHTTPERSVNSMTISGDAAPVDEPDEPGWNPDPFGVWDVQPLPLDISGNTTSLDGTELTIATVLDASEGHFTMYNQEWARALVIGFLETGATGTPVLSADE